MDRDVKCRKINTGRGEIIVPQISFLYGSETCLFIAQNPGTWAGFCRYDPYFSAWLEVLSVSFRPSLRADEAPWRQVTLLIQRAAATGSWQPSIIHAAGALNIEAVHSDASVTRHYALSKKKNMHKHWFTVTPEYWSHRKVNTPYCNFAQQRDTELRPTPLISEPKQTSINHDPEYIMQKL